MIVFPAVSRLAQRWTTGRTLRLNMVSEINKAYATQLGVVNTPTFILFNAAGQEVRRWLDVAPDIEDLP